MKKTVFKALELGGAVLDLQFTLLAFQFDALGAQFLALFLQLRTLQEHGHDDARKGVSREQTAKAGIGRAVVIHDYAGQEHPCNEHYQQAKKAHGMLEQVG